MTTKVTIRNESNRDDPEPHVVLVKRGQYVVAKVYPGEQTSHLYVWSDSPITIEEAPLES